MQTRINSWPGKDFFIEEAWVIILQIVVALAIGLGVRRRRKQLQEIPRYRFVALGFTVGSKKITIGLVLAAVAILYGSFIVSWAIQTVFMEEVLRRRQVELGVRMSMARLVHYFLILVGFMIALSALGFDLKNITILGIAGAFVGGFIATKLGIGSVTGFDIRSLLIAVGGAVLLLVIYRVVKK